MRVKKIKNIQSNNLKKKNEIRFSRYVIIFFFFLAKVVAKLFPFVFYMAKVKFQGQYPAAAKCMHRGFMLPVALIAKSLN